jgi:hypothetical protein
MQHFRVMARDGSGPLMVGDEQVSVTVHNGSAVLRLGVRTVDARAGVLMMDEAEAALWAYDYTEDHPREHEALRAVVRSVHVTGEELHHRGARMATDAHTGVLRYYDEDTGRMVTLGETDPEAARGVALDLLAEARVLMAWGMDDEHAYREYVAAGMDTPGGWLAPRNRQDWKAGK